MTATARQIATRLGPLVSETRGLDNRSVTRALPLVQAEPGCLTFVKPGSTLQQSIGGRIRGLTVIANAAHAAELEKSEDVTILVSSNPRLAFIRALSAFFGPRAPLAGVHPTATVASDCLVSPDASIGAYCVVGSGCQVGPRSVLHPHVTLYANVRIGADVVVHSGTVIGADGFGYERNESGELEKFPHVGGVVIEDNVEIGSNTSIDRGTLADTLICEGARIDNQVHISHNVTVGRHTAVIAQSMVGGSVQIGDHSWLAPAAIILNQVKIGRGATVGLGAVVVKEVPDNATVMGSPAASAEQFRAERSALKALLRSSAK